MPNMAAEESSPDLDQALFEGPACKANVCLTWTTDEDEEMMMMAVCTSAMTCAPPRRVNRSRRDAEPGLDSLECGHVIARCAKDPDGPDRGFGP